MRLSKRKKDKKIKAFIGAFWSLLYESEINKTAYVDRVSMKRDSAASSLRVVAQTMS